MKKRIADVTIGLILIGAITFISQIAAASNDENRRPSGPPPVAIKACEGKEVGDAVTFAGRRGEELKATCKEIEGQLAAVPDDMGPNGPKNQ